MRQMPGFAFLQLPPHLGAGVQAASGPKGRAPRGAELSGLGQEAKGQLGPQGSGPGRHQTQACVLHGYLPPTHDLGLSSAMGCAPGQPSQGTVGPDTLESGCLGSVADTQGPRPHLLPCTEPIRSGGWAAMLTPAPATAWDHQAPDHVATRSKHCICPQPHAPGTGRVSCQSQLGCLWRAEGLWP